MNKSKIDAVILAAGLGKRIIEISKDIPKGFIEINGNSLIHRSIRLLKKSGIENIFIVTGYKKEFFENLSEDFENIFTVNNSDYKTTGSFGSFLKLKDHINNSFILLESDILYDIKILEELINDERDNVISTSDYTYSGDEVYVEDNESLLVKMSKDKSQFNKEASEFIGICKISISLFHFLTTKYQSNKLNEYEEMLVCASKENEIYVKKLIDVNWCEIDTTEHLNRAKNKIYPLLKE